MSDTTSFTASYTRTWVIAFIACYASILINRATQGIEVSILIADFLFLLIVFFFLWYFCGKHIIRRSLTNGECYLIASLTVIYFVLSILSGYVSDIGIPSSVVMPTSLVILIPSILISPRLALVLAMTLPLSAFLTGSFDLPSYFFLQ